MTLYDLLKKADAAAITRAPFIDRFSGEDLTEAEKVEIYDVFIGRLLALTPKPDDEQAVLLASPYKDSLLEDDEKSGSPASPDICVTMYHLPELKEAKETIREYLGFPESADGMTDEEIETLWKRMEGNYLPVGYAFEFTEWETVLGWEVDPENVERIGKDTFLACVLYELSFNGFTRESQNERRRDLDERCREADEFMKLTEEEQKERFTYSEEIFEKFDGYTPLTQEEKEEISRKAKRDWVWNSRRTGEILDRFLRKKAN